MAKQPNYTNEQVAEMVDCYVSAENDDERLQVVSEFAEKFGKPKRSVVAKLVREGVYKRPEAKDKTGAPVVRKDTLADQVAEHAGINNENDASSLAKANKNALRKVLAALRAATESDDTADTAETE